MHSNQYCLVSGKHEVLVHYCFFNYIFKCHCQLMADSTREIQLLQEVWEWYNANYWLCHLHDCYWSYTAVKWLHGSWKSLPLISRTCKNVTFSFLFSWRKLGSLGSHPSGDTLWSFLPFGLLTKMDGYKDGMPNLQAFSAPSIGWTLFCIYRCNQTYCPTWGQIIW